ncbi:hypothetical protein [Nocardiopsis lucentensis]|uniref:hypothetical protein n=1 Tax=Nocardiopsis lucentensis TaxID=53441 RepID=UPI0003469347|nr:hypothetical protein [Nocardiopsis lucentensis]
MTHRLLRNGSTTFLTLVVGLCVATFPLLAVVAIAPDGTADLEAYRAAEPCPAAPAEPSDCLWTQEFTVSDVHLVDRGQRHQSHRTTLTDADGGTWESTYGERGPVLHRLDGGDRVTGTVWRGQLTEIAFGGEVQETDSVPADERTRVLIGALVIVPPGLITVAVCFWRLARLPDPEPTDGMGATLSFAVTLLFIGLFSPVLVSGLGEKVWPTVAVWLPLGALAAFGFRVSVTHKRARAAVAEEGAGPTGESRAD